MLHQWFLSADRHPPSSSSRLAPPPVLTWLTLSSVFHLAQQVAVSPPPGHKRHTRIKRFTALCTRHLAIRGSAGLRWSRSRQTQPASIRLLLTDDCDAARFGHLDHFVHQVLRPFGKVVPLKHADRTVPHDLLGPADRLRVSLGALRSAVQTLQRRGGMRRSEDRKQETKLNK